MDLFLFSVFMTRIPAQAIILKRFKAKSWDVSGGKIRNNVVTTEVRFKRIENKIFFNTYFILVKV